MFMFWKIQGRKQIKNSDNTQIKYNSEKSKQHKIQQKQNYPGLVAFYDTWPGNEAGLFYNAPKTTLLYPESYSMFFLQYGNKTSATDHHYPALHSLEWMTKAFSYYLNVQVISKNSALYTRYIHYWCVPIHMWCLTFSILHMFILLLYFLKFL